MSYETYRVADLIDEIAMGPFGSNIKVSCFVDSGVPVLNGSNLEGFSLSEKAFRFVTKEKADSLNKANAHRGDIVITHRGTLGQIAFIPQDSRYDRYVISQSQFRVRCNDKVLPEYLVYYFHTPIGQHKLLSNASQVGVPALARPSSTFQQIEVVLPELSIQKRVVEIISTIQKKIANNQELNDNLLQQAIALYEHLLQEAEWPTATILDIAEKVAMGPFGSNIKVSTFVPEGVPIISGNHLRGYFLEEPEFNYITEEHAERLKNSIVYPHDLIFTHAGNIGQVAMIPDGCKYDRYVLSQRQFYLRCDATKVVPEFLLMFFHSASGQHELLSYANQTGVPSIAQPASNLKKIPFKCPPMQEQLKWQEQVHPLLGRYLNNRLENEKLSALRDALLLKLMSGELDVSNIQL